MSDHEFEKKVQLKMDDLRFRPSDAVWLGVEKKIRQDKRRRRLILWLPVLLLGLSAGGYLVVDRSGSRNTEPVAAHSGSSSSTINNTTTDNTTSTQQPDNNNPASGPDKNTEGTTGNRPVANDQVTTNKESIDHPATEKKEAPGKSEKAVPVKRGGQPVTGLAATAETGQQSTLRNNATNRKPTAEPLSKQAGHYQTNSRDKERFEKPVEDRVTPTTAAADTRLPELLLHSSAIIRQGPGWTINTGAMIADPLPDPASANAMVKNAKPAIATPKSAIVRPVKKWKFGLEATGGFANISTNNFLNFRDIFQSQKSLVEDLSAPAPGSGFTNANSGYSLSLNPPLSKQSDIRTGYAYSFGAFAEKPLSRKLSLSLGIRYTYNSVQTTTGRLSNTSQTVNVGMNRSQVVNQYWAGRLEENYVNRYHFITIPVAIHWQLNNSRKLPVRLDGGLSVSRLLSSNALHYDGISGIYYKDNSLFNRTQVGLLTGVNIGVLQRSKHPITIGPTLRYSLTGIVKKEVSAGQYLWSTGLSVKMLLKK